MFAIMVPISLAPLIVTLFWAESKASRLGLVKAPRASPSTFASKGQRILNIAEQLDIVGLTLLGAGVALILLPLTLSQTVRDQWQNGSIIAMLVVGFVVLFSFALWDLRYAKRPVIAKRFLMNYSVMGAAWIGFFDFVSFYLTFTYLYSFVLVVKPWCVVAIFGF